MRKLVEVKGISEQKAQKLKEIIKTNNLVSIGFQTATSRLECMKDTIMLSTGWYISVLFIELYCLCNLHYVHNSQQVRMIWTYFLGEALKPGLSQKYLVSFVPERRSCATLYASLLSGLWIRVAQKAE